jgi:trimethylamine--corrinoid protein Co-methyltransferase
MNSRRRRRRESPRERRLARAAKISKMTQPVHNIPIYEILNDKGVELIHEKSMEILKEVGIDFYLDEAHQILKDHGVEMKGDTAFFEPGLIEEYISKAPDQFTQLARNPDNNLLIGADRMVYAPVYGPPYVRDLERGRREATLEDFQNFVKLAYLSPYIHHSGGTVVEPTDISRHTRHLDMLLSHVKYSDKAFMGSVMSGANAEDSVKMVEILFGEETIRENPALISLINISSPRRLDERMLEALTAYAKARQAVIITPFILSGAMAPVSTAGTLIQQNAEALAGIAYAQMVEPGTPVVYGSFMTNVDLMSGAPMFGTPESQLALFASAQMARRYNLPFRSGGMFASSKVPDAQAAYESVMTMLPAVQARVNFVLHAAGWLENGLAAGYEKFVMDCELLGMFHKLMKGIDLSEDAQALESLHEVAPGGHHLGTKHTISHFETAFFKSKLFNYDDAEKWALEGGKRADQVAAEKVKELLAGYEAPEIDPGVEQALNEFITKRKAEINS